MWTTLSIATYGDSYTNANLMELGFATYFSKGKKGGATSIMCTSY